MQSFRNEEKMYMSLPSEEWIFEAQARLWGDLGYSPGFISITNKRVVFEPGKASLLSSMLEININNILKIDKTYNLLIIPNSFKIFTKDGSNYKFLTWSRNFIVKILKNQ